MATALSLSTLDIYSHVLPGLQEPVARRFDEGLEGTQNEVSQENVGKIAIRYGFAVEFEAGRGVRVVYGDGLENRCPRKGTVGSNPTPSATSGAQSRLYLTWQNPEGSGYIP